MPDPNGNNPNGNNGSSQSFPPQWKQWLFPVISGVLLLSIVTWNWSLKSQQQQIGQMQAAATQSPSPTRDKGMSMPQPLDQSRHRAGSALPVDNETKTGISMPPRSDQSRQPIESALQPDNETKQTSPPPPDQSRHPIESALQPVSMSRPPRPKKKLGPRKQGKKAQWNSNDGKHDVCVNAQNPRTGALFHGNYLLVRGNGTFRYTIAKCDPSWPLVRCRDRQLAVTNFSDLFIRSGDEFCGCSPDVCGDVRRVQFRQYHGSQYPQWAAAHNTHDSLYLPLGPRKEFGVVRREDIVPSSRRKLLFNLIISPTSKVRVRMFKELQVAAESKRFGTNQTVLLHMTPRWQPTLNGHGFIKPRQFKEHVMDSVFTLCPAGHNPEQFRIFEAAEAGSIPVLCHQDLRGHRCQSPFQPLAAAPFLWVNRWDELPGVLANLTRQPAELDAWQRRLVAWTESFWVNVSGQLECLIANSYDQRTGGAFGGGVGQRRECVELVRRLGIRNPW